MSDKQIKIIQDYLEVQIISDSALREKYDKSKIEKCWSYIKD